jgi:hypothetical protein
VEILAPKCGTLCFVDIACHADGSFTAGVILQCATRNALPGVAKYSTWRAAKTTYKHKYKIDMSKHTKQIYNKLYNYYYNTSTPTIQQIVYQQYNKYNNLSTNNTTKNSLLPIPSPLLLDEIKLKLIVYLGLSNLMIKGNKSGNPLFSHCVPSLMIRHGFNDYSGIILVSFELSIPFHMTILPTPMHAIS